MSFVIEPAQTYWGYANEDHSVMSCRLRVPKGSTVAGVDLNHLLIKRAVLPRDATSDDYEILELVALRLGYAIPNSTLVKDAQFLGVLRLTERLSSFAVFANGRPLSIVLNMSFTSGLRASPEGVRAFADDLLKRIDDRVGD